MTRDIDMPIEYYRDETDRFDKAAELAEEIDYWKLWANGYEDDPAMCYNCGCYGREVDEEGSGEYICPNCGDQWNIYYNPADDLYLEVD